MPSHAAWAKTSSNEYLVGNNLWMHAFDVFQWHVSTVTSWLFTSINIFLILEIAWIMKEHVFHLSIKDASDWILINLWNRWVSQVTLSKILNCLWLHFVILPLQQSCVNATLTKLSSLHWHICDFFSSLHVK